jgi:DNA-binding response OmpR family regulator
MTRPNQLEHCVLVADADPDAGAMYGLLLEFPPQKIAHAIDGREALVLARTTPLSLVITETVLPFVDGYSLCEILRREPATHGVPILVVTADARADALARAMVAGADGTVVKPAAIEVLHAQATRLLERSHTLRERSRQQLANAGRRRARAHEALGQSVALHSQHNNTARLRYETSIPPGAPPVLQCPSCDRKLAYVSSCIGGVSEAFAEQWDDYTCPNSCGRFQYRHRTRKLQPV